MVSISENISARYLIVLFARGFARRLLRQLTLKVDMQF